MLDSFKERVVTSAVQVCLCFTREVGLSVLANQLIDIRFGWFVQPKSPIRLKNFLGSNRAGVGKCCQFSLQLLGSFVPRELLDFIGGRRIPERLQRVSDILWALNIVFDRIRSSFYGIHFLRWLDLGRFLLRWRDHRWLDLGRFLLNKFGVLDLGLDNRWFDVFKWLRPLYLLNLLGSQPHNLLGLGVNDRSLTVGVHKQRKPVA